MNASGDLHGMNYTLMNHKLDCKYEPQKVLPAAVLFI